jgi:hypothetical protein
MEKKTLLTIAFVAVVTLFALAQTETSSTVKELMTPEEFKDSWPMDPTLIACALVLLAAVGSRVIFAIVQTEHQKRRMASCAFFRGRRLSRLPVILLRVRTVGHCTT